MHTSGTLREKKKKRLRAQNVELRECVMRIANQYVVVFLDFCCILKYFVD